MKYEDAPDLKERMKEIISLLGMDHVNIDRVECLRGYGSTSRRTIARCHALGKLMQRAMKTEAFYAIEFLDRFEKMSRDEQDKVIIHELMHIPKSFGGGFRQHDFVCEENVEILHKKLLKLKREPKKIDLSSGIGNKGQDSQYHKQLDEANYNEERQSTIFKFPFWK